MASHYLRKYGVAATVDFELYETDGTDLKTDATAASGDVTLNRDEGGVETLDANTFSDHGSSYSLVLSIAEMTATRIIVHVVDQGTKAWLDKVLIVETYGNASAMHPFDLGTAQQSVTVAAINNIDFGATMKASINTEVDNALNTAIPAEPVADSVNERIATMDGTVATNLDDTVTSRAPAAEYDTEMAHLDQDLSTTESTITTAITNAHTTTDGKIDVIDGNVDTILTNTTALKKIGVNKWAIVDTSFIIYDDDAVTPLYTFTLDDLPPTSRTPV